MGSMSSIKLFRWGTLHALTSHFFFIFFFSPSFDNCVSLASVATFKLSTSFHQYLSQDIYVNYDQFIYQTQLLWVSGRRTRKVQKRNKFVLMLNGFMLRDCAHIRRFERQPSRQVGCNYRLNQFCLCVCVWDRELVWLATCPPFTLWDGNTLHSIQQTSS